MAPVIPIDIITSEILPKLPAKSLIRFKCVCKSFKALISTPEFINLHLLHSLSSHTHTHRHRHLILHSPESRPANLSSIDIDSPDSHLFNFSLPDGLSYNVVAGSCNGLLCIGSSSGGSCNLILINPSTGIFKKLPFLINNHGLIANYAFGFGFDSGSDVYKVVRVSHYTQTTVVDPDDWLLPAVNASYREVMVYSLKADSWKLVEKKQGDDSLSIYGVGAVIDNHLVHWKYWCRSEKTHRIRCFDLRGEEWGEDVPLPDHRRDSGGNEAPHFADMLFDHHRDKREDVLDLGVLDGCLCLSTRRMPLSTHMVDIWVMKEYGNGDSWMKMLSISSSVHPLAYHSDLHSRGQVLIKQDKLNRSKLVWYDIKGGTPVAEIASPPRFSWACLYKGSLVELPCGGKLEVVRRDHE